MRTSLLTGLEWTADEYLRFKKVWFRNLKTWPYFNLAGLGRGEGGVLPLYRLLTPGVVCGGWNEHSKVEVTPPLW